ncbi:hypothetical protein L6452_41998 [Arctium lappa]|uniref:Uncharacterized protein n=1 Tax=Arctium lappa TaxID=4217 RepID=A0ACB8XHA3_ARCLA|nr:hypothetical protein L6452_41998 [Arctium lappa]
MRNVIEFSLETDSSKEIENRQWSCSEVAMNNVVHALIQTTKRLDMDTLVAIVRPTVVQRVLPVTRSRSASEPVCRANGWTKASEMFSWLRRLCWRFPLHIFCMAAFTLSFEIVGGGTEVEGGGNDKVQEVGTFRGGAEVAGIFLAIELYLCSGASFASFVSEDTSCTFTCSVWIVLMGTEDPSALLRHCFISRVVVDPKGLAMSCTFYNKVLPRRLIFPLFTLSAGTEIGCMVEFTNVLISFMNFENCSAENWEV